MNGPLDGRGWTDPQGAQVRGFDGKIVFATGTTVPANAAPGYSKGCIFIDRDASAGAQVWINEGTDSSAAFKALPSLTATGAIALAVSGVAAGYKLARGETALDGSNPTPAATGLTTIVAAVACIKRTTAVSSGTAFVTVDFTGSDGTLNLYGWVLAGTASSGTETVEWIAIGT